MGTVFDRVAVTSTPVGPVVMGRATSSRSRAILRTSSMFSTKCSFITLRICSGISGKILLIILRHNRFVDAVAVGRHQLFFQTADRQDVAAKVISPVMAISPRTGNLGQRAADTWWRG